MLVIIGTVPYISSLHIGKPILTDTHLKIKNSNFPIERGTAAMAASAAKICEFYGMDMPLCILGGEESDGMGTNLMFSEVISNIDKYDPDVITLHYMFPKIAYGQFFIEKINSIKKKPQLIADAGGMYLIKTVKAASLFDVFTPDEGELYFLADEYAPHPLYVRSELLDKHVPVTELIDMAYKGKNTAKVTVIKGVIDYVYKDGIKIKEVSGPNIPAMEAVGGTGDTITGTLSALRYKGDSDADYKALILNRLIGQRINCTAATQISEFIKAIPRTLEEYEKQSK